MRVHSFPERAGALAMHDPDAVDAPLPTGGKVIVQQSRDLGRTKSMQIQLTRDRQDDGFVGIFRSHGDILASRLWQAIKNPPLSRRVFDTHTSKEHTNN